MSATSWDMVAKTLREGRAAHGASYSTRSSGKIRQELTLRA